MEFIHRILFKRTHARITCKIVGLGGLDAYLKKKIQVNLEDST
jgi:hypothetical protein